jgi:hypothetical protein
MKRRADGSFLPENPQSTRPADASLFDAKARRLREEKINFVCLDSRATKSSDHADPVTAVTDSDNLTLLMCSYSAGSSFESATSSSSGEIQVDSRPSLNRASLPGRSPKFRKSEMCRKWHRNTGSHREENFLESIHCSKHVLIHIQLSENGNQRVSVLPASGSKRI